MDMQEILKGNEQFAGKADKKLLKELAEKGQKPIATIISCSDSRVPVEVIFNQSQPGTFFIIRIAGNVVADSSVKGSIEYAVEHLKTPYVIVLGHTGCGAVKARLEGVKEGEIGKLVSHIKPKSKELSAAVMENVEAQVNIISEMHCVKEALNKKEIKIYGMLYDITSGKATVLSTLSG
jgi:carbonic anhydrase